MAAGPRRAVVAATYAPVGAGLQRDQPPFGRTLLALEDDPENPAVAAAADEISRELLAAPGHTISPFVLKSMRECLRLADPGAAASARRLGLTIRRRIVRGESARGRIEP